MAHERTYAAQLLLHAVEGADLCDCKAGDLGDIIAHPLHRLQFHRKWAQAVATSKARDTREAKIREADSTSTS
jgi:hypothetical protein